MSIVAFVAGAKKSAPATNMYISGESYDFKNGVHLQYL
jgi:hypothetical protein